MNEMKIIKQEVLCDKCGKKTEELTQPCVCGSLKFTIHKVIELDKALNQDAAKIVKKGSTTNLLPNEIAKYDNIRIENHGPHTAEITITSDGDPMVMAVDGETSLKILGDECFDVIIKPTTQRKGDR